MPDRKKLSQYLRDLLTAQADVTATPQMPRQEPMTIGPRTGVRDPAPQSGPLAAIARSMAPSEDTPMGVVNEMLNPLRQGAAARELASKAVGAIQRREMGRAAGLGALAAMSVPGVPGPDDMARRIRNPNELLQQGLTTPKGRVTFDIQQSPAARPDRAGEVDTGIYALDDKGDVVGYFAVTRKPDGTGVPSDVSVNSDYQRAGIGTALYQLARETGITRFADNPQSRTPEGAMFVKRLKERGVYGPRSMPMTGREP